jgi:hypothetical protein
MHIHGIAKHSGGVAPTVTFSSTCMLLVSIPIGSIMRSSAVRAFSAVSRTCQHNAHVTASVSGSASSIPAYIVPSPSQEATAEAYIAEEELDEPEASRRRRSQAAEDGTSRIGMVELPAELQLAVSRLVEGTFAILLIRRFRGMIDKDF